VATGSAWSLYALSRLLDYYRPGTWRRIPLPGAIETTASGELVFTIFSALAQFEQCLIQERTRAGLKASGTGAGTSRGKKPIAPDDPHVTMTKTMHKDTTVSIMTICHTLNISGATFYRYLNLSANPGWSL